MNLYRCYELFWAQDSAFLFHVSKTGLLSIHLLMCDTSFYSKEGLEYVMSLEFISY